MLVTEPSSTSVFPIRELSHSKSFQKSQSSEDKDDSTTIDAAVDNKKETQIPPIQATTRELKGAQLFRALTRKLTRSTDYARLKDRRLGSPIANADKEQVAGKENVNDCRESLLSEKRSQSEDALLDRDEENYFHHRPSVHASHSVSSSLSPSSAQPPGLLRRYLMKSASTDCSDVSPSKPAVVTSPKKTPLKKGISTSPPCLVRELPRPILRRSKSVRGHPPSSSYHLHRLLDFRRSPSLDSTQIPNEAPSSVSGDPDAIVDAATRRKTLNRHASEPPVLHSIDNVDVTEQDKEVNDEFHDYYVGNDDNKDDGDEIKTNTLPTTSSTASDVGTTSSLRRMWKSLAFNSLSLSSSRTSSVLISTTVSSPTTTTTVTTASSANRTRTPVAAKKKSPKKILRPPTCYTYAKGISGLPTQRIPMNRPRRHPLLSRAESVCLPDESEGLALETQQTSQLRRSNSVCLSGSSQR